MRTRSPAGGLQAQRHLRTATPAARCAPAQRRHHGLEPFHVGFGGGKSPGELGRLRVRAQRDGAVGHAQRGRRAPQLLGDERGQRVQQAQQRFQHVQQGVAGAVGRGRVATLQRRLASSRNQSQNSFQANSYRHWASRSKR
jgi:hypothetical protein